MSLPAPPTPPVPIPPRTPILPKHTILAILSGMFASLASLSAKLISTTTPSTTPIHRTFSLLATILSNLLMWLTFSKALAATPSTVEVTVLNTATNIALTGVLGKLVFGEVLGVRWWIGAACIVAGSVVLTEAQRKREKVTDPGGSQEKERKNAKGE
ncbi:hypothetical protein HDV00_002415 [Rhizophlyctis rosea]|nr:hypothetical protein HDV00_002415 [Rhizophlyctis rosea]